MLMAKIETEASVPLPPLAALADDLQWRTSGLEDSFREAGETLANAIDTIDGMAEGLDQIRQALSPETAGAAVAKLRHVAYRLITLPIIQQRRAVEVETLTGRTRELRTLLNEVGTILNLLGIYGMNIKIASSGEPAFFNFVVGMDEKLETGRRELHHIEKELDQFGRVVADVRQADHVLVGEVARAGVGVPAELTGNANALQDHVESVMRMTDEVGGIVRTVQGEVARILGAIQIGDSVRQRAEHGIAILRRIAPMPGDDASVPLPPAAAAHMARLVAAQLTAMGEDFGRELTAIVHSLERLGPLAESLRGLLAAQGGGADGQILIELENGIARLGDVTDQLCRADGHLASLTIFVGRTLEDLTKGLTRIQNIALNVQDISTNTQLLCRRHGNVGRAVAVIAKEVAPCASRLDQLSKAVAQLIRVLAAIDLVQDTNATDASLELTDALAVVRSACDLSGEAMNRSGGAAARISDTLRGSAIDLSRQQDFVTALDQMAAELELRAGGCGGVAPTLDEADEAVLAELLPWAAGLYTMAAERTIHARFLLPGMEVAPTLPPVTFDDDDDGLF